MSTTDMTNKELRKQKRDMKKAAAVGNSPVESKKGGANEEPVLKSPNEPVTVTPAPILSNEQIAENRAANIAKKEQMLNSVAKDIASAPQRQIMQDHKDIIIDKPQDITMQRRGFIPENYTPTPVDRAKIEQEVKNSQSFKDMLEEIRTQNSEYEQRQKDASRIARANAMGNLLVALGQAAGGGKQTYVKPTTGRYLTESMAKVDEARKMYDAIREKNENRRRTALKDATDALERQHLQNESMKANAIKAKNELGYRIYQDALKNASSQGWLNFQMENMNKNIQQREDEFKYKKQSDKERATAAATEAKNQRQHEKEIAGIKASGKSGNPLLTAWQQQQVAPQANPYLGHPNEIKK